MSIDTARQQLEKLCREEGFTPPQINQGLSTWLDESLDGPLAPRGSAPWRAAQENLIEAFELALAGAPDAAVRAPLRLVVQQIRGNGRRDCACVPHGATFADSLGRDRCAKCLGRVHTSRGS